MQGLSDLASKQGTGLFKIDYDVQDEKLVDTPELLIDPPSSILIP